MDKDKVLATIDELDEIKCTLLEQGAWSILMRVIFRHIDTIRSEVEKSEPLPEPPESDKDKVLAALNKLDALLRTFHTIDPHDLQFQMAVLSHDIRSEVNKYDDNDTIIQPKLPEDYRGSGQGLRFMRCH